MATSKKTTVPATAKQPQDRQAKAEAKQDSITVTLAGGEYVFERDAIDDVEFLEALEDNKDITAFRIMRGDAQWTRLKESLRDERGKVRPTAMAEAMDAALNAIGGEGNSAASSGS